MVVLGLTSSCWSSLLDLDVQELLLEVVERKLVQLSAPTLEGTVSPERAMASVFCCRFLDTNVSAVVLDVAVTDINPVVVDLRVVPGQCFLPYHVAYAG